MKPNQEKENFEDCLTQTFDFDEWKILNEKDPQLFEAKREAWLEDFIGSAPQAYQANLRQLMSKVDNIKAQSDSPMQSCVAISKMMVTSLNDLGYFLKDLKYSLNGFQK